MKYFLAPLLLLSLEAFAGNQIFYYGPPTSELIGILDMQTFPGPPNYESINSGDEIERHFYLKPAKSIDVLEGKNFKAQSEATERNVKIIQLAVSADNDVLWARFRKAGKGAHVKIRGEIFHRFTGHHHSRVLLSVEGMELLSP